MLQRFQHQAKTTSMQRPRDRINIYHKTIYLKADFNWLVSLALIIQGKSKFSNSSTIGMN